MKTNLEKMFVKYLSVPIDRTTIGTTRLNTINSIINKNKNIVNSISKLIVKDCFEEIDNVWFQNSISACIKEKKYKLNFAVSKRYKNVAGTFGAKGSELSLTFSETILNNLFKPDTKFVEISGHKCSSLVETLIVLMEHEITHLILFLLKDHKDNIGTEKSGHTITFKRFVNNVFGHTKVTHQLNLGDIEQHHKDNKENAKNLTIGDHVSCKGLSGILVKMNESKGTISITDEKYITTYLKDILFVKKGNNNIENELLIKLKAKGSKTFSFKLNGKILNVQILSFNSKSVKLKNVNDNTIFSVYFWYLIGKI